MKTISKLIIGWLFVSLGILLASPISQKDAENVAKNWMQNKFKKAYHVQHKLYAMPTNTNRYRSSKHYSIVELEPQGWVIVSLDDSTRPILAYGNSKFDRGIPPALQSILQGYEKYVRSQKKKYVGRSNSNYIQQWNQLKSSKSSEYLYSSSSIVSSERKLYSSGDYSYIVRPLLWLGGTSDTEDQGIRWNQGEYYNAYTPVDENGYHTPVGCIATAMGQVMRYWKYPDVGVGEHCYTPYTHPEYGEQCANFGETLYDWESMPLTLTSANDAVAQALYHIGVSVDMDYAPEGSGAGYRESLKKYFGYKLHIYSSIDTFNHENMHYFLDQDIPLLVSGCDTSGGGCHAYILDGYDSDGYYHVNLGWNGSYNGKYLIDNIDVGFADYNTTGLLIVAPSDPSDQVDIIDDNFRTCIMEELDIEASEDIREWTLAYYSNWLGCFDGSIENANEVLYFKNALGINFSDNNLTGNIDFSNNTTLNYLYIDNNGLISMVLPNNNHLIALSIYNNNLSGTLDLTNESNLTYLNVDNNEFTSIMFPNKNHLETLYVSHNHLTGILDLSNAMNLTNIYISDNNISTLVLPGDTNFDTVSISYNTNLDLTEIENLKNIESLLAYGTKIVLCSTLDQLKIDNNITNIYMSCNHPPKVNDDNETTSVNRQVTLDVLANDSDDDGDSLAPAIWNTPSHGIATVNNNMVIYTPDSNYVGDDSFTYKVQDEHGVWSGEATVSITVLNHAPVSQNDDVSTYQDTSVTIDVLANDSDDDGDSLAPAIWNTPSHGIATVNNNMVIYTPDSNYVGDDSFTYKVQDEHGVWSGEATVDISILSDKKEGSKSGGGGASGYLLPLIAWLMLLFRREEK